MGAISNLPTNPNKVDSTPNSIRPAARHSFSGLQHELNVLLRQPLSHLGELFQGLYRGRRKSKSDHEVVFNVTTMTLNRVHQTGKGEIA